MILVVCLNPALDITYHVPAVDWEGVNRPSSVHARPGGKGVNVARTLRSLGLEVLVMGLAGDLTGAEVVSALGAGSDFVPISGQTRRTVTIVDSRSGAAALFSEPGPLVSSAEFREFAVRYEKAVSGCAAVVLSGSLPPGLPTDTYATLISMASAVGMPAVLDTHGEALLRGAAAGPAIVKPNLAELEALAGRSLRSSLSPDKSEMSGEGEHPASQAPDLGRQSPRSLGDCGRYDDPNPQTILNIVPAAGQLVAAGAQAVVVSLGADGLLAVTPDGNWHAAPPGTVAGNATGAGDAVSAGLVRGLVLGHPWDERLRHAVALGTASVAAPVAGEFSHADYTKVLGGVKVRVY